ncbi:uncharacterized protein PHALS_02080 [Plasmopara halstedii]|uniref:Uncharacterized protein n=1 Tax=Plasmopara halstedii TaxID=4781 RepID=A0A0P1AUZ8_PLAHL|nr:uncharacterized protein PHALS_02080 [Plasmopara halstedii]CEG45808.1 hypothetical protein PHALS_02080 [Plasmopara halstedii]|eukprot:XP_024582177.1 hypothetical protein PHALS_02080 [Plasmopara halstedii]
MAQEFALAFRPRSELLSNGQKCKIGDNVIIWVFRTVRGLILDHPYPLHLFQVANGAA